MKNSNKKAIAMALLISAVISPVGKEAFAAEPTPTETIGNQNTSDQKNTDQPSNEPGTSGEDNGDQPSNEPGTSGEDNGDQPSNEPGTSSEDIVEPKVEGTNQSGDGGSETTQHDQKTDGKIESYTYASVETEDVEQGAETIKYEYSSSDFNRNDPQAYIPSKGPFQSIEFYITSPDGKTYRVDSAATGSTSRFFTPGSTLSGKIIANPNTVLKVPTSAPFKLEDLNKTVTGYGKNAYITYTLESFEINNSFSVSSWGSHEFNIAEYWLNGGSWTDERTNDEATDGANYLQLRIPMYSTVYKPTDPERKGYEFLGWTGSSYLNNNYKEFKKEDNNYYQFDENDNKNSEVGWIQGVVVKLYAQWEAKKPTFETENVTIKKGESVSPESLINKLNYNDDGVIESGNEQKIEIIGDYDNTKPDKYRVTVKVTNGVGGVTEKDVVITVTSDADDLEPKGKTQTVKLNTTPEAKNSIDNVDSLPEGTEFEYKSPVDTSSTGDKSAVVVVTYPDGSKEEVEVTVKVVSDADEITPEGKTQTVKLNTTPEAKNSIDNVDSLPEGTEFAYKDPVDTSSTGDKSAVVVVTYPDGSKEEVEVIVRVVSDSDSNGSSENNSEVPNQDETNKPSTGNSETNDNNPSIPGTPGKDQPEINYPIIPDYTDEDEKVVVPSPDENKPELPSTENTVTPDKSEESEDQDTSKKPEDTVKPGTPDKTENSDDIEESGEQETTDGKDDGDKVIVPTPDNKKPEDSEESGTTDKKDDDGKIRVPSINKDNEPDDRHSSSKIKQSSESSIISADDNNTGTNVTRSPRSGHDNVQTGVSGAIGVASILAAASLGLAATKKKEDEEE